MVQIEHDADCPSATGLLCVLRTSERTKTPERNHSPGQWSVREISISEPSGPGGTNTHGTHMDTPHPKATVNGYRINHSPVCPHSVGKEIEKQSRLAVATTCQAHHRFYLRFGGVCYQSNRAGKCDSRLSGIHTRMSRSSQDLLGTMCVCAAAAWCLGAICCLDGGRRSCARRVVSTRLEVFAQMVEPLGRW